jgi:sugar lactone lactonase YvrE
MKKIKTSLFVVVMALISMTSMAQTLTLKWSSDTLLRVPESVLADSKNNVLYVANIDGKPDGVDGQGFISKLSADGKITNLKWVTGLDAPKGLGVYKNNLYVADIHKVAVIDIAAGKVTSTVTVDNSVFLNDITVDEKGTVYVTDSGTGKVHKIVNGKAEVFFESADIKGTNGVLAAKDGIYIVDFPTGVFYKVDASKKLTKISTAGDGGDGIVSVGKNEFIISCWHGQIFFIDATGKSTLLLDTRDKKISSADVGYDEKTKTLYVPTFFANSVMAYEFKK